VNPGQLRSLSIFELVALYVKAAEAHGKAREDSKPRAANKQNDIILSLEEELQRRGHEGHAAMLRLMEHESRWVRLLAAGSAQALSWICGAEENCNPPGSRRAEEQSSAGQTRDEAVDFIHPAESFGH